jgi:hypothetical protein
MRRDAYGSTLGDQQCARCRSRLLTAVILRGRGALDGATVGVCELRKTNEACELIGEQWLGRPRFMCGDGRGPGAQIPPSMPGPGFSRSAIHPYSVTMAANLPNTFSLFRP